MAKQPLILKEGVAIEALKNAMFKVQLSNNHIVLCTISGKMRINNILIKVGDNVKIEMTPYDLTKGRITERINVNIPKNE